MVPLQPPGAAGAPQVAMESRLTQAWVEKASQRSKALLELAGKVADPAPVEAHLVSRPSNWPHGRFMLAWLEPSTKPRQVRHLPDASFFLRLLEISYRPVLEKRPDLRDLLSDATRPEMSITNDVLQIQLRGLDTGYSMIRHHSLMLFTAALWLDSPRREQWLQLYDELVTYVDSLGRPSLERLRDIETSAFADFHRLAPDTIGEQGAAAVIADEGELKSILDYQLYAAVAIGLLWREYRALPEKFRRDWFRRQLSELYVRPEYLEAQWNSR
jgi:hypothetical protein